MGQKTVLYVEDDYLINKYSIPCIEERCDCSVINFDNTQDAMEFIENGRLYDLAIIDLMATIGFDGENVITLSKRKNPHIPVIAISQWGYKPTSANVIYQKNRGVSDLLKMINDFLR